MTDHEHERATRETEEWFLRHGLPFFVEGRKISVDDLAHGRSVIILALAYFGSLVVAVPSDRPWPERLLLAAAGLLALVAVWAVANLARRQRALERPRRVGIVEVAVFALGPAAVVAVLQQDPDLVLARPARGPDDPRRWSPRPRSSTPARSRGGRWSAPSPSWGRCSGW